MIYMMIKKGFVNLLNRVQEVLLKFVDMYQRGEKQDSFDTKGVCVCVCMVSSIGY